VSSADRYLDDAKVPTITNTWPRCPLRETPLTELLAVGSVKAAVAGLDLDVISVPKKKKAKKKPKK
jgi:hypothetical protein